MSHKRKANLHKVRTISYVRRLYWERVCLLSVNRWILYEGGEQFLRAELTCAESRNQQKSRYRRLHVYI
jgi:hypothetical protein